MNVEKLAPHSTIGKIGLLMLTWSALVTAMVVTTTASDAVPDERIVKTLLESSQQGRWDLSPDPNGYGLTADRYTDCVAFTQGLGNDATLSNAWQYSWADLHLAPEGCEGVAQKLAILAAGQPVAGTPYFRYWHGYSILTRPLLAYTDLPTLRIVFALLLVAAMVLFLTGLYRKLGRLATVTFAIPLLMTADIFGLPESMPHSLSWSVLLICGAGAVRWASRGPFDIALLGLVSGSVFVFFDFLLYPAIALMVFLFAVLTALYASDAKARQAATWTALGGICWASGYALTWISKWVLAASVFGFEQVKNQIQEVVSFRVSGHYGSVNPAFAAAVPVNWRTWTSQHSLVIPVIASCLVAVAVCVAVLIIRRGSGATFPLLFTVIACIPLIWYISVSNHSQIHSWFTYRNFPAMLACLTAGWVGTVFRPAQAQIVRVSRNLESTGLAEEDQGVRTVGEESHLE